MEAMLKVPWLKWGMEPFHCIKACWIVRMAMMIPTFWVILIILHNHRHYGRNLQIRSPITLKTKELKDWKNVKKMRRQPEIWMRFGIHHWKLLGVAPVNAILAMSDTFLFLSQVFAYQSILHCHNLLPWMENGSLSVTCSTAQSTFSLMAILEVQTTHSKTRFSNFLFRKLANWPCISGPEICDLLTKRHESWRQ